ncbi:MAG: 1-acyl-sn-glycerol-3-phosphate acyltransferase [Eubacterium sp.]|nr:1-acyl-sn-glycerol-3-phosphate acyltransferase [Eubacterium sp.]
MLNNKHENMLPFDMSEPPVTVPRFLKPLMLGASYIMTRSSHLKIRRIGMEKVGPTFLVLSMHQGFSDYYIAPLALYKYNPNYISDMEGFAAFGKTIYRNIGCIGKRRYVPDVNILRNIGKSFEMGNPVVIFPESRHSNVGTTSYIPKNMGRLAKHLAKRYGTPLVTLSIHGSYLTNPFGDEEHTRKGKTEATLELLYTANELVSLDEETIQQAVESKLNYDEYAWQQENHIGFTGRNLAKGLHLPLYLCPACNSRYTMISRDDRLGCTSCRKVWKLSPYGYLYDISGKKYSVTDWYDREREDAESYAADYSNSFSVRIEALPNEYGFVKLGTGTLTVSPDEFTLSFSPRKKYNYTPSHWTFSEKAKKVTIHFPHRTRESLQTEYNYRGRGPAVVLSHQDMTYYIYSDDKDFNPTELQFIAEYLYRHSTDKQAYT